MNVPPEFELHPVHLIMKNKKKEEKLNFIKLFFLISFLFFTLYLLYREAFIINLFWICGNFHFQLE
jgi:hypothetical protein